MIDSATGMKPGERYSIEHQERTRSFPGFFLDGKYFLGPELMTAVGWLEGQKFLYDQLDAKGDPVFPDRVAGTVEDLTLILSDGTRLALKEVRFHAPVDQPVTGANDLNNASHFDAPGRVTQRFPTLTAITAIALGGIVFALLRRATEKNAAINDSRADG